MNNIEIINNIAKTSNHSQYLTRMNESYNCSSKKLIPLYLCGEKILDVGCGSGILMKQILKLNPTLDIMGIDINDQSVQYCLDQGLNVKKSSLEDLNEKFDTIIFSSVLHEFSSYAEQPNTYSALPIINALNKAYNLLNPNGIIIIRDGIKGDDIMADMAAYEIDERQSFIKYVRENPIYNNVHYEINGQYITAPENVIKEFLFTYTWGPDSYSRELQEKYGILTVDEWQRVVKFCKFNILSTTISAEEYAKYLSKKFYIDYLNNIFAQSTILMVACKQ